MKRQKEIQFKRKLKEQEKSNLDLDLTRRQTKESDKQTNKL